MQTRARGKRYLIFGVIAGWCLACSAPGTESEGASPGEQELTALVNEFVLSIDGEKEEAGAASALDALSDFGEPGKKKSAGKAGDAVTRPPPPKLAARQMEIVEQIAAIRGSERTRWLLELLAAQSAAPNAMERLVYELSVSAGESDLPRLAKLVKMEPASTAFSAARVIGHVGGPKALEVLKEAVKDPRRVARMGAIEGLGYCECEEAGPLIERFLNEGTSGERETAWYAQREWLWRTGKPLPKPDGPAGVAVMLGRTEAYSPGGGEYGDFDKGTQPNDTNTLRNVMAQCRVLTIPKYAPALDAQFADEKNSQVIRDMLGRGGVLWVTTDELLPNLKALLKSLGVIIPADPVATGDIEPKLFVSPADPWRVLLWPRNLMYETTLNIRASGFWRTWDKEKQVAPLRSSNDPNLAALIVQSGVAGQGTVVFSKLGDVMCAPKALDVQRLFKQAVAAIVSPYNPELPESMRTSTNFVSPHIPWAKPLAGDKINVLFASQVSADRDMVEIMERVDCNSRFVSFWDCFNPLPGHTKYRDSGVIDGNAIVWLETELGKPWNVLVTGGKYQYPGALCYGASWKQWPDHLRYYVQRKLFREGRGLVIFGDRYDYYGDQSPPCQELRRAFEPVPFMLREAIPELPMAASESYRRSMAAGRVGKGWVVVTGRDMPVLRDDKEWAVTNVLGQVRYVDPTEYWYAQLARAVQVAGGKAGPVLVQGFDLAGVKQGKIVVRVRNGSPTPVTAQATLRLRNKLNQIAASREVALQLDASADGRCVFDFDSVSGACIAEFRACDKAGNVAGWANSAVTGGRDCAFAEIRFDQDLYPLNATVKISGRLTRPVEKNGRVRVSFFDVYDREVSRGEGPIDASGAFVCELPTGPTLSRLMNARIEATEDGRGVSSDIRGFLADVRHRTDFFCAYPYGILSMEQARNLGVASGGETILDALKLGLEVGSVGFGDGGMHGMSGNDPVDLLDKETLNGWSSPKYHLTQLRHAAEAGPRARLSGARVDILADEDCGWYTGWERMGYEPSALHEFRMQLRQQYKTLDALNKEWETSFKDWREVRPMHSSELGSRKSFAAYVDHRLFMEWQFAYRRTYTDVMLMKQYVPDAQVGFSTEGDDYGWDLYKMARNCTAMVSQLGIFNRKYNCWSKPGDFIATWFGGYQVASGKKCEKVCHFMPWARLFSGDNGLMIYADPPGATYGYLRGDYSPTPVARTTSGELREIQSGAAKLLLSARRDLGKIANYHSKPAYHTMVVQAPFAKDANWDYHSESRFVDLGWQELGWPQLWVAPEEVVQGRLEKGDVRMLLMNATVALSAQEAEHIRRFVQNGGMLLGFVEVGSRDEHGGPPLKGQLADVFGFEYEPDKPCSTNLAKRKVVFPWEGKSYDLGEMPTPTRPMKVTTAKEISTEWKAGRPPHVLVNEFGKGTALFFNLAIRLLRTHGTWVEEGGEKRSKENDQMFLFLKDLATQLDADPDIHVSRTDDQPLWRVDVAPFRSGTAGYYGVVDGVAMFRTSGWTGLDDLPMTTQEVVIAFDQPAHMYEVRSRKYFGETAKVQVALKQATAQVFARLPYKVTGVTAKIPGTANRGAPLPVDLSISTSKGPAADHVILLEVTDAVGKFRWEYRDTVLCPGGKRTYPLPIACNDPPGRWTIRATDVVSGEKAEIPVEVKP